MFTRSNPQTDLDVLSDEELIDRLVGGDGAAFNVFYARYSKLIYHVIKRIDTASTDDIFQDFFYKLQESRFKALRMWNRSSPLPSFLRQVVRNFTLDKLRTEKPRRAPLVSDALEGLEVEAADPSAEEAVEMRDLRRGAIRAWAQLPSERDRRLVCGKYFRDTPSAVAAERERLNPGAYRKALFDAQRRYLALVKLSLPEYFS